MKRFAATFALVLAAATALSVAAGVPRSFAPQPSGSHGPAGAAVDADRVFHTVDIHLESDIPIAAWQFAFATGDEDVMIVGVEEATGVFTDEQFFFDHRAVREGSERIIVAGFSTQPAQVLQSGQFRVATIHIMGPADPDLVSLRLEAAADADGCELSPDLSMHWGRLQ